MGLYGSRWDSVGLSVALWVRVGSYGSLWGAVGHAVGLRVAQPPTCHSNPPTAIPDAAAVPANPTKCPEPMLDANSDAPT